MVVTAQSGTHVGIPAEISIWLISFENSILSVEKLKYIHSNAFTYEILGLSMSAHAAA